MKEIPRETYYSETVDINNIQCRINGLSVIGGRNHMEDTFMSTIYPDLFVFGIFDGHGGSFTSKHLPLRIESNMTSDVRHFLNNASEEELIHFFQQLFFNIDKELQSHNKDSSGSTAILGVITERFIILVNCGDSRGVLYDKRGFLLVETVDHTPKLQSERDRILNMGGRFINSYIEGSLAVSRSFGDYRLKNPGREFISITPDVYITKLTPSTLILGSDGIWDRVNPHDISKSALLDGERLSRDLVDNRYTGDNKTVLVVEIEPNVFF